MNINPDVEIISPLLRRIGLENTRSVLQAPVVDMVGTSKRRQTSHYLLFRFRPCLHAIFTRATSVKWLLPLATYVQLPPHFHP